MQETISTGQQVVLRKITWLTTKNVDWCGSLQILPQTIPLFLKDFFLQKIASPFKN